MANSKEDPSEYDFTLLQNSADIILVSGDEPGSSFYVHRAILAIASPCFEVMFRLPQPVEESSSMPQIRIPETQQVLSLLLRLIYPVPKPKLNRETLPISSFVELLEAATKYDIYQPVSYLRSLLVSPEGGYLRSDPMKVFAVACRFDLEKEKQEVMRWILRKGFDIEDSPLDDELKWISLWEYRNMDQWIKDKKETIADYVESFYEELLDLDLTQGPGNLCVPACNTCDEAGFGAPRWWSAFVNKVTENQGTKIRSTEWLFSPQFLADVRSACHFCRNCRTKMFCEEWFIEKLKEDIDLLVEDRVPDPGDIRGYNYSPEPVGEVEIIVEEQ